MTCDTSTSIALDDVTTGVARDVCTVEFWDAGCICVTQDAWNGITWDSCICVTLDDCHGIVWYDA